MAELLKDQYYLLSFYKKLGEALESQIPNFHSQDLLRKVKSNKVIDLDLKTKMYESARLVHRFLPKQFDRQIKIIKALGPDFEGLEGMFLPAWVELFGTGYLDKSVDTLRDLTQYSSSEFAIRPFIISDQSYTLQRMLEWTKDENEHVRRLASEGCRPRLPWAMALTELKKDPSPIFPILETLKADESLYVRKSVANNINDITKDHPDQILDLLEDWGFGNHIHTDWIIKHGLRSLIKAGNSRALKLLGYGVPKIKVNQFELMYSTIKIGDTLDMKLSLKNLDQDSSMMIDYAIHFVRDKGKTGRKVFKWKSLKLKAGETMQLSKTHSFKVINTRKYYPGEHVVEVQVNGDVVISKKFELKEL